MLLSLYNVVLMQDKLFEMLWNELSRNNISNYDWAETVT